MTQVKGNKVTSRNWPSWTDLFLILTISLFTLMECLGQVHEYENVSFDIVIENGGDITVCLPTATERYYSGPSGSLTWQVTGGSFVYGNSGTMTAVLWVGPSMSLSATGEEISYYYDAEYVQHIVHTTYTSNPFNPVPAITEYGLSATPYYAGTSGAV